MAQPNFFSSTGKSIGRLIDHGVLIIFLAGFGACALLTLLGWGCYEAALWAYHHVRIV